MIDATPKPAIEAEAPVWAPFPKQVEFMTSNAYELLYGGAAGGGKSDAMVVDALGLNIYWRDPNGDLQPACMHPRYRAALIRTSYPELEELMFRAQDLYPAIWKDAVWHVAKKEWRFPNYYPELSSNEWGARVSFKFIERYKDAERMKSDEYQYVAFDELTLQAEPKAYEYVKTRVRGVPELKKRIRSASNPDGPGYAWVKDYFKIPDDGTASKFEKVIEDPTTGEKSVRVIEFLPATLDDNPYIDEEYKFNLLAIKDERLRNALRYGRWDSPKIVGAIYEEQLANLRKNQQIVKLPIHTDIPVNTFWDLGRGDATAIWLHQKVGNDHRFIGYYENSNKPLAHYVNKLDEMRAEDGFVFGVHYLPHDANHRKLGAHSIKNFRQMLNDLGLLPTFVVPRAPTIKEGIDCTRGKFSTAWIDPERCARGLSCLTTYRWKPVVGDVWAAEPLHDWASNGADAFRQWAQGYRDFGHGFENEENQGILTGEVEKASPISRRGLGREDQLTNPNSDWVV